MRGRTFTKTKPLTDQEKKSRNLARSLMNLATPKPPFRAKVLHRGVQCVEQPRRTRVEQRVDAHLVHRVAEAHLRVGIGEAQRAARARMPERMRVGPHLDPRLRQHEAQPDAGFLL